MGGPQAHAELFHGRIEKELPPTITSYGLWDGQPLRNRCIEPLHPVVHPYTFSNWEGSIAAMGWRSCQVSEVQQSIFMENQDPKLAAPVPAFRIRRSPRKRLKRDKQGD